MALVRDVVGVEVCPLVMVKVMKAFVRIVIDQDEQVLHSTVRVRQTFKCFVRAAKRAALEYIIEHIQCCYLKKSVVNVNTSSFSYFPINTFSVEHVIQSNLTDFLKFVGILLATHVLISLAGFCVNFINICTGTSKMVGI